MTRPTWDTVKGWGHKSAKVIVVLAVAATIYGLGWGIDNAHAARDLAQTNVNLSQQNLNSQNNHHAATVKADKDIETEEKVIAYLGGVIVFQQGEVLNAHVETAGTLADLQSAITALHALQQEINLELPSATSSIVKGQAQINAYLGYLTCVTLNPTDTATCGAVPPLPGA